MNHHSLFDRLVRVSLLLLGSFGVGVSTSADVVINEIFYNSPNDLEDLEYIELLNSGSESIDVSGWKLSKGVKFTFPKDTILEAGDFAVVAKDAALLKEFYDVKALGEYSKSLSNSGDELQLSDKSGRTIETVKYSDQAPWPKSPDGYSASLERICPDGAADRFTNWAPSKLSDDYDKLPAGSPGRANSVFAKVMPPEIGAVTWEPAQPKPGELVTVSVRANDAETLQTLEVHYRLVSPGAPGEEQTGVMLRNDDGVFTFQIPAGDEPNRLLRFRIVGTAKNGGVATVPPMNELRPTFTAYVNNPVTPDQIPVLQFFHVGKEAYEAGESYRASQEQELRRGRGFGGGFGGFGGFGGDRGRFDRGRGDRGPGDRGPGNRERGDRGRGNQGFGFRRNTPSAPLLPQGESAAIYTDAKTGKTEVFDFVNISERKSGWKVRFHKDRPLLGMTTINCLYEPSEETILNESLAYQLYQAAGNASYLSGYTRVIVNGKPAGYHLYFEQPNGNFFRRNQIADSGDLYKLIWMGNAEISDRIPKDQVPKRMDIARRYEKKTNPHQGYQDLIQLVEKLEQAKTDDEMWTVIQQNIDVENVVNYFAVNSLLSHWDGFFNNYFVYFDRKGNGKWSMYPWDQDSTWSQRGGRGDELYEMPLFFGAEGATPEGIDRSAPARGEGDNDGGRRGFGFGGFGRGFGGRGFGGRGFGGGGFGWWRPGGDISRPLLANPQFYKRFLTRVQELTDSVFTEAAFGPNIDRLQTLLEPEVRLRARMRGQDEAAAVEQLSRTTQSIREHLVQRREFVQAAIKKELAN